MYSKLKTAVKTETRYQQRLISKYNKAGVMDDVCPIIAGFYLFCKMKKKYSGSATLMWYTEPEHKRCI